MIDSYIILFSTFPQGDIWTRAEQLENWNEQVKESGAVNLDQSQMAALLFRRMGNDYNTKADVLKAEM